MCEKKNSKAIGSIKSLCNTRTEGKGDVDGKLEEEHNKFHLRFYVKGKVCRLKDSDCLQGKKNVT